jgi:hypothetical protein
MASTIAPDHAYHPSWRDPDELVDGELFVGEGDSRLNFPIHRFVLVSTSAFFHARFVGFRDRSPIDLSDILPPACWCVIGAALDTVYTTHTTPLILPTEPIECDVATLLLKVASVLQIPLLARVAIESIVQDVGRAIIAECGMWQCTEAVVKLREVLAVDPAHPQARYYLSYALETVGDREGAIAELRLALASEFISDSLTAVASYNLGILLKEFGDYDGAGAAYDTAIRVDPTAWKPLCKCSVIICARCVCSRPISPHAPPRRRQQGHSEQRDGKL